MIMFDGNAVDAVAEEVVTPQETPEVVSTETPEVSEPSESVPAEVAPVAEKTEQSPEENAKFAEVRRKAEKEAIDKFISDQYGKSHNIHSKAEYDKYVAEQRQQELLEAMQDENADPKEIYRQMKEADPEYQEMKRSKQETYVNNQISDLNKELEGLGLEDRVSSLEDLTKLPNSDKLIKYVEAGNSLTDAYFLANRNDIISKKTEKIQNDTIEKIAANGNASPGSLADTGETPTFFTKEQVDAMSDAQVMKNLDVIHKSMKSW